MAERCGRLTALSAVAALAGCAEPGPDPAELRAGQERACAVVVAEHVGMTVEQVTPSWQGATPEGRAIVLVDAPGRPHTCEVDDGFRVYALQHPRE